MYSVLQSVSLTDLKCQILFLKMLKLSKGEYGHYNDAAQVLKIINIFYGETGCNYYLD